MRKLIILISLICFSCQSDVHDITIKGVISDIELGTPIKDAKVEILCWKYGNSADQSYAEDETKAVITNEKGEYEISFDYGAYMEIKVRALGYKEVHKTEYITKSTKKVNIELHHN